VKILADFLGVTHLGEQIRCEKFRNPFFFNAYEKSLVVGFVLTLSRWILGLKHLETVNKSSQMPEKFPQVQAKTPGMTV